MSCSILTLLIIWSTMAAVGYPKGGCRDGYASVVLDNRVVSHHRGLRDHLEGE